MPLPVSAMRPAAIRACSSSALSWRTRSAEPAPWPSTSPICGAQLEDPCLERVLLGLELGGRLQERRPLLRRVADPRALRAELRRDQEAEHQQRGPQGDLPARDAAEAAKGH